MTLPIAEKKKVLSTRITAPLRDELEAADVRSGRSFSSEVEHRLRRSFEREESDRDQFGSTHDAALMRLIANVVNVTAEQAGRLTKRARGRKTDWLSDPYVFDQAVMAVNAVLEVFRPLGPRTGPQTSLTIIAPPRGGG